MNTERSRSTLYRVAMILPLLSLLIFAYMYTDLMSLRMKTGLHAVIKNMVGNIGMNYLALRTSVIYNHVRSVLHARLDVNNDLRMTH